MIMPDIFSYCDYRKFLQDWYEEKKRTNRAVSFRMIARQVGYRAPGYLSMLIQGKIKMSLYMCVKFCSYMKLKKKECDYLQNMVLFCDADSHEEKQVYFDKLKSFKEVAVRIVGSQQYRFYEKWYHSAVRAILEYFPFHDEYEKIGKLLLPEISASEVKESIVLLKELGLIDFDKEGYLRPTESVLSTGYDATGMAVNTFLFNTLRLSESALGRFSKDERNFSCLTLGISENGFKEIRQELRDFRRRILKIAEDDNADRIYQLSFQLFPLSRRYFRKDKRS